MNSKAKSIFLWVGILLLPIIFCWVTLKKGFSIKARLISFGWMFITLLAVLSTPPKENTAIAATEPEYVTNEVVQQGESSNSPESTPVIEEAKIADIDNQEKETIQSELSSLSDCEFSSKIMVDVTPLLQSSVRFLDETDHRRIAEWRVATFNETISNLQKKYNMTPAEFISEDRAVSSVVYTDFLSRLPFFVQEIYKRARDGGDKQGIKEQFALIRNAGNLFEQSCLQHAKPSKEETTPAPNQEQTQLIKMSKSGICHSPSSASYDRTKNYTAYTSIESCIANGGRLPKR
ncbi:hypothetical protein [Vibrio navarrensis]|uniref:hypothetical protein n=1 Tax=Vibrio navarrensis TaxID=29495 RepID=UPI0018DD96C7|nr:hypothetical protein [Vibrio navarrensis]MBH9740120.1 hypothetical protein [Vibrio navarrensis]